MNSSNKPLSGLVVERAAETRWWLAVSTFVLVGLLAAGRYLGPFWLSDTSTGVSAERVMNTLDMLLGEEQSIHTAGSRENELVRLRLLGALDNLGAQSWVLPLAKDERLSPDDPRDQAIAVARASMANIVARVPGSPRSRPLVLATHYDACPQGPGAGDAGQCVSAILEAIHVLQQQGMRHEVWCLFTDGEELGLWGAKDLVQRDDLPWGDRIPLVINFDARGDRGAALLYETHIDNLRAMRIAAPHLAHPRVTSSLMVNVYQRLPNGTDFTPFRKAGWSGWNFAVIDGAERYHTAEDTIENLSPRSAIHFAAHAVRLVRAVDSLTPDELDSIEDSEPGVFFDVLGTFVIVYASSWNRWHLALTFALWCVAWFVARRRLRGRYVALAAGLIILALTLSAVVGWLIALGLKLADVLPKRYVPYGDLICLLYPISAGAMIMALGRSVSVRCNRVELTSALVLLLCLIGLVASEKFPGGAYLLVIPAGILSVLMMVDAAGGVSGWADRSWGTLASVGPALLYAPTYVLLTQALGPRYGWLIASGAALMLLPTLLAWSPTELTKPPQQHGKTPTDTMGPAAIAQ